MGKFDHQLPQETHRQLPQEADRHDHEQTNAFTTREQGSGVSVLARLAAVGNFAPAAVADVIRRYPGELEEILRALYSGPGMQFVQQVTSHVHGAMDASRQGRDGAPMSAMHHASDTAPVADVGVMGGARPHLHGEEKGATSGRAADPALLADVTCSLEVGEAEPASLGSANPELGEPPLSPRAEYERGVRRGKVAVDYLTQIESAFMPGFRRSIDALDDAAAREFGILMLGGLREVEGVEQELHRLMSQALVLASGPGDVPFDASSLAVEHARMMEAFDTVAWRLPVVEQMLVERVGPTLFRGDVVMPGTLVLPIGPGALMALENEAATTIALVATVRTVLEAVPEAQPGRCPMLTEAQRQMIVQEITPWKGRPVNFAFLKRVLSEYGVWDGIQDARPGAGPSVAEMDAKSAENRSRFGAFTDIGDYDEDEAFERLNPVGQGRGAGDLEATFHTTDTADAKAVFRGLVTASPDGQAKLILRLSEANKLDVLCEELPWQWVEALAESVHKAPSAEGKTAFRLLEPHYADKGGEESMRQYWAELGTPGKVGAFVHDLATAGGMSRMSDTQEAHNAGGISDEEFARAEGLTAATSIGITALTGMSGQFGGTVGGKLATRFGAGEVGQFFGASIGGGVAGSVGGRLSGDVLAQLFEGKEGFDSLGSYAESAGIGAGVGFAAAAVSFGVARYLPPSEQSWAHRLAAQHPEEARTIEALATGSPGSRIRIRVPRRRAVKLGELGVIDPGAGLPVPAMVGPPPSLALADVAEPDILLDLELAGQLAGGTPLAHVIQSRMLGADEQGFDSVPGCGGGGGLLGAGDRSVLGEGPEVDALYAEEPIPEPSRLPAEQEGMGWWEGQRGNSNWWPDKPEVQAITRGKPIRFVNFEPDFSPWSKGEVKILGGRMTGGRADTAEADRIFAMRNPNRFADADAVASYRDANRLSWHHKMDMETLQLVPSDLNDGSNTPHLGGASLARRQP